MNKWKFKEGAEPQGSSDGFWYDLTSGGYIKLEKVLEGEQLEMAKNALATLKSLEDAMENAELLNDM